MPTGIRSAAALLVVTMISCRAGAPPSPRDWTTSAERGLERSLSLPEHSVKFGFATDNETVGAPDLAVTFEWPAANALGYEQGRVTSLDPLRAAIWHLVPAGLKLRRLVIYFAHAGDEADGYDIAADSLDRILNRAQQRVPPN
jgi:hypothetical protein